MTNQKHADYHRQDNRDKLKPEMRHLARVDETDALHDTANNQDTAQEKDRSERRYYRVDQRQNASENHQTALYKIPKRMALDRLAHCLAHSLGGSFERHGHGPSPSIHVSPDDPSKRICRSGH